jgi:hypothetical protein
MKVIKKVLLGLVILIAVALIAALFVKKDSVVSKSVKISLGKSEVFDYVKYLKNQDNYSVWAQIDPDMIKTARGVDGNVGFVAGWISKNEQVGVGEQEILSITDGERIDYELRFLEPFESKAKTSLLVSGNDTESTVTWTFEGSTPYPFNLMLLFMDMDKMIGKDFETGLNNLKVILEKKTKE